MKNYVIKLAIVFASVCSVSAHIQDYIRIPGLRLASLNELNFRILKIESFFDFLWANLYVGFKIYNPKNKLDSFTMLSTLDLAHS